MPRPPPFARPPKASRNAAAGSASCSSDRFHPPPASNRDARLPAGPGLQAAPAAQFSSNSADSANCVKHWRPFAPMTPCARARPIPFRGAACPRSGAPGRSSQAVARPKIPAPPSSPQSGTIRSRTLPAIQFPRRPSAAAPRPYAPGRPAPPEASSPRPAELKPARRPAQTHRESAFRPPLLNARHCPAARLAAIPPSAAAPRRVLPEICDAAPARSPVPAAQTEKSKKTKAPPQSPPAAPPAPAIRSPAAPAQNTAAPEKSPAARTSNSAAPRILKNCAGSQSKELARRAGLPASPPRHQPCRQRDRKA